MLVDDAGDAGLRTLETMAVETIRRGWHKRSLAHHARAMALYPTPYFQKVSALLNQAHMGVVSDPLTGPLHARIRELLDNGNLVCLGQDDISNAYYPFGRNNMLGSGFPLRSPAVVHLEAGYPNAIQLGDSRRRPLYRSGGFPD